MTRTAARLLAALAVMSVLASVSCRKTDLATQPTTPSTLVWSDEFNGAAGSPPDPTKWKYEVGTGWGNAQLEYDTNRTTNVALDGAGHLLITARQESYLGSAYTSGRINTRGLFSRTGGRFEARIQLPIGRGIWPAFWLLGDNIASVGWPSCGEIDVMEYRGQAPATVLGSAHGPGYSGGNSLTSSYSLPSGDFSQGFHVFAVEWTASRITWSVDGNLYKTITPSSLPSNGTWVFDHPFSILLNLAVGGTFVGSPDASTVFPQSMIVDWVRVYRIDG